MFYDLKARAFVDFPKAGWAIKRTSDGDIDFAVLNIQNKDGSSEHGGIVTYDNGRYIVTNQDHSLTKKCDTLYTAQKWVEQEWYKAKQAEGLEWR